MAKLHTNSLVNQYVRRVQDTVNFLASSKDMDGYRGRLDGPHLMLGRKPTITTMSIAGEVVKPRIIGKTLRKSDWCWSCTPSLQKGS